jgi:enamine deaminase RidA (YjgF/YER057c/UK114 family)
MSRLPPFAVLCAGQIGLEPASMQLVPGGARAQLRKSLRNTARVLAACGSALPLALSAVLYVSEAALSPAWNLASLARCVVTWCAGRQLGGAPARAKAQDRAALADGAEGGSGSEPEESAAAADGDGDEAEEDSESEAERQFPLGPAAYCAPRVRAVEAVPPVLVLVVPALPREALVEVEVAAFTCAAVTESGGLRALCARGTNAAAASVCVPACVWSCTAAAWRSDADVDGLVAALGEQASQCGLAAAKVGGAQLRVRAFLEQVLWPRAAEVEARLSAALGAERGAVSAVPVTRVALGDFVCDYVGLRCGIAVIISTLY